MPNTATTSEIQKSYRKVFDKAKKSGPVFILTNNQPDVVILSATDFDHLCKTQQELEMVDAMKAIHNYQKAKKSGHLIKLNSLADLI